MMMAGICSEAFPVFSEAFLSSQINALTSEVSKWILISVSSSADNACVKPGSKDAGSNFLFPAESSENCNSISANV